MKKMIRISETEKKNIMRATALFSATVLFATTAFTGQVRAEKEIEVQALKTEQDQETLADAADLLAFDDDGGLIDSGNNSAHFALS